MKKGSVLMFAYSFALISIVIVDAIVQHRWQNNCATTCGSTNCGTTNGTARRATNRRATDCTTNRRTTDRTTRRIAANCRTADGATNCHSTCCSAADINTRRAATIGSQDIRIHQGLPPTQKRRRQTGGAKTRSGIGGCPRAECC